MSFEDVASFYDLLTSGYDFHVCFLVGDPDQCLIVWRCYLLTLLGVRIKMIEQIVDNLD